MLTEQLLNEEMASVIEEAKHYSAASKEYADCMARLSELVRIKESLFGKKEFTPEEKKPWWKTYFARIGDAVTSPTGFCTILTVGASLAEFMLMLRHEDHGTITHRESNRERIRLK